MQNNSEPRVERRNVPRPRRTRKQALRQLAHRTRCDLRESYSSRASVVSRLPRLRGAVRRNPLQLKGPSSFGGAISPQPPRPPSFPSVLTRKAARAMRLFSTVAHLFAPVESTGWERVREPEPESHTPVSAPAAPVQQARPVSPTRSATPPLDPQGCRNFGWGLCRPRCQCFVEYCAFGMLGDCPSSRPRVAGGLMNRTWFCAQHAPGVTAMNQRILEQLDVRVRNPPAPPPPPQAPPADRGHQLTSAGKFLECKKCGEFFAVGGVDEDCSK